MLHSQDSAVADSKNRPRKVSVPGISRGLSSALNFRKGTVPNNAKQRTLVISSEALFAHLYKESLRGLFPGLLKRAQSYICDM